MKCPFCGDIGDKVVDSRESREGDVIRRRRQCLNATGCRSQERDIIEGRALRCASALAQQGNQTAFISTDGVGCP